MKCTPLALAALALALAPSAADGGKGAGKLGTITGVVTFDGEELVRKSDKSSDQACAGKPGYSIVSKRRVRDAYVRVLNPPAGEHAAPATPVVVSQDGCEYTPRVVAGMKGGTLEVRNGDPTFHNVRGMQAGAVAFNLPQNQGARPIVKPIEGADGDTISLHCDVHPWMQGYVRVSEHPYFATTGADGTFTLPALPAGKYRVEVWHPNLGSKTATVKVKKGKKAKVSVEFDLDDCGDC